MVLLSWNTLKTFYQKIKFPDIVTCITEREKLFLQNLDDTCILVKRKKGNTVSIRDCIEGNMCIQVKINFFYLERTKTNMGMASHPRADKYFDKSGVVGGNFD